MMGIQFLFRKGLRKSPRALLLLMGLFFAVLMTGVVLLVLSQRQGAQGQGSISPLALVSEDLDVLRDRTAAAEQELMEREAKIAALESEKVVLARELALTRGKLAALREQKLPETPPPIPVVMTNMPPAAQGFTEGERRYLLTEVDRLREEKERLLQTIAGTSKVQAAGRGEAGKVQTPSEGHARQRSLYGSKGAAKLFGEVR